MLLVPALFLPASSDHRRLRRHHRVMRHRCLSAVRIAAAIVIGVAALAAVSARRELLAAFASIVARPAERAGCCCADLLHQGFDAARPVRVWCWPARRLRAVNALNLRAGGARRGTQPSSRASTEVQAAAQCLRTAAASRRSAVAPRRSSEGPPNRKSVDAPGSALGVGTVRDARRRGFTAIVQPPGTRCLGHATASVPSRRVPAPIVRDAKAAYRSRRPSARRDGAGERRVACRHAPTSSWPTFASMLHTRVRR